MQLGIEFVKQIKNIFNYMLGTASEVLLSGINQFLDGHIVGDLALNLSNGLAGQTLCRKPSKIQGCYLIKARS